MASKMEIIVGDIYDAWRAQDLEWLGSYLPEDFLHVVHIPQAVHSFGGLVQGKDATLARLRLITVLFDFLRFDTGDLMIHKDRAGAEIPVRYRHRATGTELHTTIANFWTFEDGWPVKLVEYHDISRIQAFVDDLSKRQAQA
jgi:ketosteroid isomerase-like protein